VFQQDDLLEEEQVFQHQLDLLRDFRK